MTVAIPANMDALGCEFAVVVANHNHNKAKVYLWSRALQAPFLFLRSSDISLVYLLVRAARPKLSSLGGQHPKSRIAVNSACFAGPLANLERKIVAPPERTT
jgi:hypothetical protein